MTKNKEKILILKIGQRIRNKQDNTIYEIKTIDDTYVTLMSEDGGKYLFIRAACLTPAEYEPIYN